VGDQRAYTTEQVALILGYGLTKTKHLVLSGQIRSVKDGRNRRILPEWVDDYIRRKIEELSALSDATTAEDPSTRLRTATGAAAKVPPITVHGTRKTCGSLLAALDVHPRYAMQILRHSKIAVTMEIYTEVPSAATREALGKLGQWLDSDS
jgi:excisionase family DNA binding protein